MDSPKVSVIIPVYNVEKYLRDCLDSVINQTLREIEVICVNDGSTDGSLQILQEYATKDDRITVFNQENQGLSAARNRGMSLATGKYIYFIDSDDYVDVKTLEVSYNICEEKQLDVISFDYVRVYEDGRDPLPNKRTEHSKVYDGVSYVKELREYGEYRVAVWILMLRRDFLVHHHISFYEKILHEEHLFTFHVLMHAKRVSHISEQFYYYRIRSNSIQTTPKTARNVQGYLVSAQEMMRYALSKKLSAETQDIIVWLISIVKRKAQWAYGKMLAEERNALTFTDPMFQMLFKEFVVKDLQLSKFKKKSEKLQATIGRLEEENTKLKKQQKRQELIKKSFSYRIGRFITWLPRKIRDFFRCCKQSGL